MEGAPASDTVASTNTTGRPKRVKPALKKVHSSSKEKKELKWDEEAIEEHDQLRGTRMKIEEPNTPFAHYDSHSDHESSDDGGLRRPKSPVADRQPHPKLNWDELHGKLGEVATQGSLTFPDSPASGVHSEEDEEKHQQFLQHRKQHYNEMEAVRRFREEHKSPSDEEDDDDANDADDDMDMK